MRRRLLRRSDLNNLRPSSWIAGEVFCKHCDAGPLEWDEVRIHPGNSKAWRLVDERGNFHACTVLARIHDTPVSVDELEDLT